MAYVSVPKDLTKVKTKVALNLTKRQLIGFTIAALVSFPVYVLCRKVIPNDLSMLMMILTAFPIIFSTLYEKDGLYMEHYIKYFIEKRRHQGIRIFKTNCIYDIKQEGGQYAENTKRATTKVKRKKSKSKNSKERVK